MMTYVALLRGINVGGYKQVAMADLRDLLARLGLLDPRSLLQSGNLVFRTDARSGAQLERSLEVEAARRLALQTDFFVRSAAEWKAVVAANPFPEEAARDPGHLIAMFVKDSPPAGDIDALRTAITGPEFVQAGGRQLYILYPAGIGRSRLTNALIEKKLKTRCTGRNWNTVLKLGKLIAD